MSRMLGKQQGSGGQSSDHHSSMHGAGHAAGRSSGGRQSTSMRSSALREEGAPIRRSKLGGRTWETADDGTKKVADARQGIMDEILQKESDMRMRQSMGAHKHGMHMHQARKTNIVMQTIYDIADSQSFSNFMSVVIILNLFILLVEVTGMKDDNIGLKNFFNKLIKFLTFGFVDYDMNDPCKRHFFYLMLNHGFFLSCYMLEIVIMLIGKGKDYFYYSYWFYFDTILVIFGLFELFSDRNNPLDCVAYYKYENKAFPDSMLFSSDDANSWQQTQIRIAKIAKLGKALKSLRMFRMFKEFRYFNSLISAIGDVITSYMIYILALSIWVMLIFAIIATKYFGRASSVLITMGWLKHPLSNWATLGGSMGNMLACFGADGWYDVYKSSVVANDGVDDIIVVKLYLIFVMIFLHFILFSIFTGINIIQVQEANEEFFEMIKEEKRDALEIKKMQIRSNRLRKVKTLKDRQRQHNDNFYEMVNEFQNRLRRDDYVISDSPTTQKTWIELEMSTMDLFDDQMYKLQQLYFEMAHVLGMKYSDDQAKVAKAKTGKTKGK